MGNVLFLSAVISGSFTVTIYPLSTPDVTFMSSALETEFIVHFLVHIITNFFDILKKFDEAPHFRTKMLEGKVIIISKNIRRYHIKCSKWI